MNFIFNALPFNIKKVDSEWEHEYLLAKSLDCDTYLIDYEVLTSDKDICKALKAIPYHDAMEVCIYRGWMLAMESYVSLYKGLLERNLRLVNDPDEYKHCHYMPESYELIKDNSPITIFEDVNIASNPDSLKIALEIFGTKPIVIKDYVKSQKHHWHEACFIPNPTDIYKSSNVINRFIELQGKHLQGGLVFREYIELESAGRHPHSGMPLTVEYRIFILNKKPISIIKYWNEVDYHVDVSTLPEMITELFGKIRSNFFTIDIAKKKNGDWTIIELGDAQVAEYMDNSTIESFYMNMSNELSQPQ